MELVEGRSLLRQQTRRPGRNRGYRQPVVPGAGPRARDGHRPPRPEAREHPADGGRSGQAHRFRAGALGRLAHQPRRDHRRHGLLPGAGAGAGAGAGRPHRPVCPGGAALRMDDGRSSVHRRRSPGSDHAAPVRAGDPASRQGSGRAGGARPLDRPPAQQIARRPPGVRPGGAREPPVARPAAGRGSPDRRPSAGEDRPWTNHRARERAPAGPRVMGEDGRREESNAAHQRRARHRQDPTGAGARGAGRGLRRRRAAGLELCAGGPAFRPDQTNDLGGLRRVEPRRWPLPPSSSWPIC